MTRSALALATTVLGVLALAACTASPEGPADTAVLEPGQMSLDGELYTLQGSCGRTDVGIVAEFEAVGAEGGYAMLRFTGESSEFAGEHARATLSLDLAQGLIAQSWDGTTADFEPSFRVLVEEGLLTGSGLFLDPASGTQRGLEFIAVCE